MCGQSNMPRWPDGRSVVASFVGVIAPEALPPVVNVCNPDVGEPFCPVEVWYDCFFRGVQRRVRPPVGVVAVFFLACGFGCGVIDGGCVRLCRDMLANFGVDLQSQK